MIVEGSLNGVEIEAGDLVKNKSTEQLAIVMLLEEFAYIMGEDDPKQLVYEVVVFGLHSGIQITEYQGFDEMERFWELVATNEDITISW